METVCLTHQFLIAMPGMTDPNFSGTLTYICEHNAEGALGIIVNRPLDMTLSTLFDRVGVELENPESERRFSELPVYFGGPVQTDRGFVLHRPVGKWQSSLVINDELALTSSRDILVSLAEDCEGYDLHVTLGYAGWTSGQLEWELSQNAWLTVDADTSIIFGLDPAERFAAAMQRLGVNPVYLSEVAGHA